MICDMIDHLELINKIAVSRKKNIAKEEKFSKEKNGNTE